MLKYGAVLGVVVVVVLIAISNNTDRRVPTKDQKVLDNLDVPASKGLHVKGGAPNISLIATSVRDENAVVSTGLNDLTVVSSGGLIFSGTLKVLQIAVDRIILEEVAGPETYIVYLKPENGDSLIQTISSVVKMNSHTPMSTQ